MEISGIPQSITHDQIRQALQVLGIDPGEVCRLEWQAGAFAIYVEAYGTEGAKGSRYWDGWKHADGGDKAAVHRIAIPILNEDPPAHTVDVRVAQDVDPAALGRAVVNAIKRYEGGAGKPAFL